ncbi:hypothetical protein BFW87_04310 [Pseudomonas fluorescens]|uniref:Uncharacterized protein n=1 Tax=Pseudomonas fluorescens TaxID=294 RepID=A0A1T2Z546_PSEFL|nr:hypothetical protein [Pseudomonas fluorescens]OPA99013.1 hypothetical protein BFW87_04310 [Pseudomonas fluorescens]
MDSECKKFWHLGVPCPAGHSLPMAGELEGVERLATDTASPRSIVFGAERRESAAPVPGYNALAPQIRTVRDPALSLIALSGIDPSDPVMVEVPLVLNNTSFTDTPMISGWRIGFAQRYVRGNHSELVEHTEAFLRALGVLGQLGAQLVPVDAQRGDKSLQFDLHTRNEIDDLVTEHRLDALVSDGQSAAFHGACRSGYPSLFQALEGTTLWIYGARWSRDSLPTLLRAYRQISD